MLMLMVYMVIDMRFFWHFFTINSGVSKSPGEMSETNLANGPFNPQILENPLWVASEVPSIDGTNTVDECHHLDVC